MVNEASGETNFCLFSGLMSDDRLRFEFSFIRICVKHNLTEEEVQNLSLRFLSRPLPGTNIPFIGKATLSISTSFASVGSWLFCLGGYNRQPTNKVTKFNPSSPKFKLISCCDMIKARYCPAAISSHGILYVFGGLTPHQEENKENSTPWAEYLNTTLPEREQQWMPLDIPEHLIAHVSRISYPFAIPYNQDGTIFLIGFSNSHGFILFDTTDMSFKELILIHVPFTRMSNPVTVVEDRTMYWTDGEYLHAYEFDNDFHYSARTSDSVLSDFAFRFTSSGWGPLLVHLDKNLFCFFTMHCHPDANISAPLKILECTKFRATKVPGNSAESGHLDLELVGYQSYQCDSFPLSGVLPISM